MSSIIRPSTIQWPEEYSLKKIGITQSMMSTWSTCQRKFIFHLLGYKNPKQKDTFYFGNLSHEVLDRVYTKGKLPTKNNITTYVDEYSELVVRDNLSPLSLQEIDNIAAKAVPTLIQYFIKYEKDFKTKKFFATEENFKVPFNGATLLGKIDSKFMIKIAKWLMEHKTKGMISEDNILTHLNIDFQNLMYNLADEIQTGTPSKGTLYNVIRNSQMKLYKGENLGAYSKRIEKTIIADPDHFFKRWEVPYVASDRANFKHDVTNLLDDIKYKQNKPVLPNRFGCLQPFKCPFLEACAGDSCKTLIQDTTPMGIRLFPELQEVNYDSNKSTIKEAKRQKKIAKRIKPKKRV